MGSRPSASFTPLTLGMADYLIVDTSVFAHLTKSSPSSGFYRSLQAGFRLAMSFQTEAELLGAGYSPPRRRRLDALLAVTLLLPHAYDTSIHYADVRALRSQLKRNRAAGGDAGDADIWIVSSALEYQFPLASHDRHQVALGRASGALVQTALTALRAGNPP